MRSHLVVSLLAIAAGCTLSASVRGADAGSRAADVEALFSRWAPYVERVYGVGQVAWRQRMGGTVAAADGFNLKAALERDSFEGAMAELMGRGAMVSDRSQDVSGGAGPAPASLGSTTMDLVFTPVQPCRLLDTRVVGGAIARNSTRSFLALAANAGVDFTSQGGSNTNCGVAAVGASAVALSVTVVNPQANGYLTAYAYATSQPTAASLTFVKTSTVTTNTVLVRVPNPLTIKDFTVFTSAQADLVVDIVGYYAPPQATALDCVGTSVSSFTIAANSTNFFNNPACPAGYKAATPYCWTASSGVYSQGSGFNANVATNPTFCAWQNVTGANQTTFGGNVCCRVPGQ